MVQQALKALANPQCGFQVKSCWSGGLSERLEQTPAELLSCITTEMRSFLADEKGRGVLHFAPNPLSLKSHQIPCFTFK
jgi:hypothetical protein